MQVVYPQTFFNLFSKTEFLQILLIASRSGFILVGYFLDKFVLYVATVAHTLWLFFFITVS